MKEEKPKRSVRLKRGGAREGAGRTRSNIISSPVRIGLVAEDWETVEWILKETNMTKGQLFSQVIREEIKRYKLERRSEHENIAKGINE